jgi:lysophospholipase L1-like esterase
MAVGRTTRRTVLIGDSITKGRFGDPAFADLLAAPDRRIVNLGVDGITALTVAATFATDYLPLLLPGDSYMLWLGTNDVFAGYAAADIVANLKAILAYLTAVPMVGPIVIPPMLPRGGDPIVETWRQAFLAACGADATLAPYYKPTWASDPMWAAIACYELTYFNGPGHEDNVHPNTYGHRTIYNLADPALQ